MQTAVACCFQSRFTPPGDPALRRSALAGSASLTVPASTEPMVAGLFHVAVKTNDLAATIAFYAGVLGLRNGFRPDFGYPGAWLYVPVAGGPAIMHIYAGGPALLPDGVAPSGTAAIDHLSLACRGYQGFIT